MFQLVSQATDVEGIKQKFLEMWMGWAINCSSLYIFKMAFSTTGSNLEQQVANL